MVPIEVCDEPAVGPSCTTPTHLSARTHTHTHTRKKKKHTHTHTHPHTHTQTHKHTHTHPPTHTHTHTHTHTPKKTPLGTNTVRDENSVEHTPRSLSCTAPTHPSAHTHTHTPTSHTQTNTPSLGTNTVWNTPALSPSCTTLPIHWLRRFGFAKVPAIECKNAVEYDSSSACSRATHKNCL
jgi:hypothetical protein